MILTNTDNQIVVLLIRERDFYRTAETKKECEILIEKSQKKYQVNIFVVLGMVFCFCVSCDKEDNDVKAVENMRDWYKVEDKPGEVNHLLYKMYKYYDVTIFINDTLGQEERGVDAYGEPIVHTELFDMGYYVYGTYTDDVIR